MKRLNGILMLTLALHLMLGTACEVRQTPSATGAPDSSEAFIADRAARVIIYMKPEHWDHLVSRAKAEQYAKADFWFDQQMVSNVAVRAKGSSSLTYVVDKGSDRISLKVNFDRLHPGLAFCNLKKLNFHNNYRDPSLMRERLAYEVFARRQVPAPRAAHVDLWVNDMHMGVYTQVEQVDKVFLRRHFADGGGDLYKPRLNASYLDWSGRSASKIEDMALKTNERTSDHEALLHFLDVLNNEPEETFPQAIEMVLDVDTVLRFLAVETALVCLDSYQGRGVNYYLYENQGRFVMIPWDLNESFGTYKCGLDKAAIIDFRIDEPTCGPVAARPLVARRWPMGRTGRRIMAICSNCWMGPFPRQS